MPCVSPVFCSTVWHRRLFSLSTFSQVYFLTSLKVPRSPSGAFSLPNMKAALRAPQPVSLLIVVGPSEPPFLHDSLLPVPSCPEKSTRHSSAWPSGFLRDGPQLTFLASCFPVPHTYSAHTRTHTRDPQIESFSTYLNFSKLQSSHVRASAVRSASVRYLR